MFRSCIRSFLRPLERAGKLLEKKQALISNALRTKIYRKAHAELASLNQLRLENLKGLSSITRPVSGAFERAPLHPRHQGFQVLVRAHAETFEWPKTWRPSANFESVFRHALEYHPRRSLPFHHGKDLQLQQQKESSGTSVSKMHCELKQSSSNEGYSLSSSVKEGPS